MSERWCGDVGDKMSEVMAVIEGRRGCVDSDSEDVPASEGDGRRGCRGQAAIQNLA